MRGGGEDMLLGVRGGVSIDNSIPRARARAGGGEVGGRVEVVNIKSERKV